MKKLTAAQQDTLRELFNIGIGRAAATLNTMIDSHVSLNVPYVGLYSYDELEQEIRKISLSTVSAVRLEFGGVFSGATSLVFPPDSAIKLVDVLTGQDTGADDLDVVRIGTLTEVGNIVINSIMGTIGNLTNQHLRYSLPSYIDDTITALISLNRFKEEAAIIMAQAHFVVQELHISGSILLWFEVGSFDVLLQAINVMNEDL